MQEEIFGPVVGNCESKNFDEAIEIANNTDYGLTGAVITNNRFHIEQAREDFHVETCISTEVVQGRLSATNHSADLTCLARIPKRADRLLATSYAR